MRIGSSGKGKFSVNICKITALEKAKQAYILAVFSGIIPVTVKEFEATILHQGNEHAKSPLLYKFTKDSRHKLCVITFSQLISVWHLHI